MVLLEFSLSPFDKGESVPAYVARSIDTIERARALIAEIEP